MRRTDRVEYAAATRTTSRTTTAKTIQHAIQEGGTEIVLYTHSFISTTRGWLRVSGFNKTEELSIRLPWKLISFLFIVYSVHVLVLHKNHHQFASCHHKGSSSKQSPFFLAVQFLWQQPHPSLTALIINPKYIFKKTKHSSGGQLEINIIYI